MVTSTKFHAWWLAKKALRCQPYTAWFIKKFSTVKFTRALIKSNKHRKYAHQVNKIKIIDGFAMRKINLEKPMKVIDNYLMIWHSQTIWSAMISDVQQMNWNQVRALVQYPFEFSFFVYKSRTLKICLSTRLTTIPVTWPKSWTRKFTKCCGTPVKLAGTRYCRSSTKNRITNLW